MCEDVLTCKCMHQKHYKSLMYEDNPRSPAFHPCGASQINKYMLINIFRAEQNVISVVMIFQIILEP